jgi:SAM-dependent methyltransferase
MEDPQRGASISDRDVVASEYSDERRLMARVRVFEEFLEGPDCVEMTFEAIAEAAPRDVLEVGAGWGDLAVRVRDTVGARVTATDLSARMTHLLRQRHLDTVRADAQRLPFPDDSFDVVVANSMLYHVPDPTTALRQFARVMRPTSRLVATTYGRNHLREVWSLVGDEVIERSFGLENGRSLLETAFGHVARRRGQGVVTFPNADEVRAYVSSTVTRAHLADLIPDFDGPLIAHSDFAVFVAT